MDELLCADATTTKNDGGENDGGEENSAGTCMVGVHALSRKPAAQAISHATFAQAFSCSRERPHGYTPHLRGITARPIFKETA